MSKFTEDFITYFALGAAVGLILFGLMSVAHAQDACRYPMTKLLEEVKIAEAETMKSSDLTVNTAFITALKRSGSWPAKAPENPVYDYLQFVLVENKNSGDHLVLIFFIKDECARGNLMMPIQIFQSIMQEAMLPQ